MHSVALVTSHQNDDGVFSRVSEEKGWRMVVKRGKKG